MTERVAVPFDSVAIRSAARVRSAADWRGTIRAFYPYWDAQYRPMLVEAVRRLPAKHFAYKPHPQLLTAQQLIIHIAEAERAWMQRVVHGGEEVEMVVPHEDPAQGWVATVEAPDHAALLDMIETWHRPTQEWFDRPESELSRTFTWEGPGGVPRTGTLHWILDHVQEHEIHHRAQLNTYLRILGIGPPSI